MSKSDERRASILRISASLSLSALAIAPAARSQVLDPFSFERVPRMELSAAGRPGTVGMTTFDLEGDGDLDFLRVTANRAVDLMVFEQGHFQRRASFSGAGLVLGSPADVASGDFNGDGVLDLALIGWRISPSPPPMVVRLFYGNSGGGWQAQPEIQLALPFYAAEAADLDGDGRSDLVLTNPQESLGPWAVLRGGSTAAVPLLTTYSAGSAIAAAALGDMDGDGDSDVVLALRSGQAGLVRVYPNDGRGGFLAPLEAPVSAFIAGLTLADLDGDGDLDAATVASYLGGTDVACLENFGAGTLLAPVRSQALAQEFFGGEIRARRLDGDNRTDLVVALQSAGSAGMLITLRGLGGLRFAPIDQRPLRLPTLRVTDLGGDGVSSAWSGDAQIVPIDERGRLGGTEPFAPPAGAAPAIAELAALDLDRDGACDLVGLEPWAGALHIARADGEGHFLPPQVVSRSGSRPRLPLVGDLDVDGWPDLATVEGGAVETWLNDHQGGLAHAASTPHQAAVGYLGALGDLDGDGIPDLALTARRSSIGSLLFGRGDGSFREQSWDWGCPPGDLLIADINRDGRADLVYTDRCSGGLMIRTGLGGGIFGPPTAAGVSAVRVRAGDLDGDGAPELVAASSQEIAILAAAPAGGWTVVARTGTAPWSLSSLQLADLDRDGRLEILAASSGPQAVILIFQDRGASSIDYQLVAPLVELVPATSGNVEAPVCNDFDADGYPDLAFGELATTPAFSQQRVFLSRAALRGRGAAAPGATANLDLHVPSRPGAIYLLLASSRGSFPGIPYAPAARLPLNPDALLWEVILAGGGGVFQGFLGALGPGGQANASVRVPNLPELRGAIFDHAFALFDAGLALSGHSNALALAIR